MPKLLWMNFELFVKDKYITFLSKGWRGEIYIYKEDKTYCIKKAIHEGAIYAITKEANILSFLYGDKTYPQILCQGKDFFVYEYIDAMPFEKVFYNLEEDKKRYILIQVLKSAYKLDVVGINRGEFDKEYKNILIDKYLNVYILDFDRGLFSKKPKNLNQFIQSLRTKGYICLEKAIELGKNEDKDKVFLELLEILNSSQESPRFIN